METCLDINRSVNPAQNKFSYEQGSFYACEATGTCSNVYYTQKLNLQMCNY